MNWTPDKEVRFLRLVGFQLKLIMHNAAKLINLMKFYCQEIIDNNFSSDFSFCEMYWCTAETDYENYK